MGTLCGSFAAVCIVTAVVVAAGCNLHERWTGISSGAEAQSIFGRYRSLEECRSSVEKIGGWCGKACRVYASGKVADCAPLLKIPKKNE
jgi:hypothetical protein